MSGYNQVPEGQPNAASHTRQAASPAAHGALSRAKTCICGQRFSRSDALLRHIRYMNQEVTHQCFECDPPEAFSRADKFNEHLRSVHGPRDNGPADVEPQAQRREPALALVNEPQEQVPAFFPQVPYVLGFPQPTLTCMVFGCHRYQGVFSHQEDLYLHTQEFHAMSQGTTLYQPGTGYPNTFSMNNAFGHENGYNQGQGMNYYPIQDFIPGNDYSMNAVGQQGNEHQQFDNYGPIEDLFQYDDYMNRFGEQDDFQQPGGPSHGDGF